MADGGGVKASSRLFNSAASSSGASTVKRHIPSEARCTNRKDRLRRCASAAGSAPSGSNTAAHVFAKSSTTTGRHRTPAIEPAAPVPEMEPVGTGHTTRGSPSKAGASAPNTALSASFPSASINGTPTTPAVAAPTNDASATPNTSASTPRHEPGKHRTSGNACSTVSSPASKAWANNANRAGRSPADKPRSGAVASTNFTTSRPCPGRYPNTCSANTEAREYPSSFTRLGRFAPPGRITTSRSTTCSKPTTNRPNTPTASANPATWAAFIDASNDGTRESSSASRSPALTSASRPRTTDNASPKRPATSATAPSARSTGDPPTGLPSPPKPCPPVLETAPPARSPPN